ncbi:6602_t:CDS:1 [Funneliformis geosporum]|uniref:Sulfhydryl oxidase n=1 Tax=Funneliformis geosporum TaxID=1117311 RepID=A0A9W4T2Q9_9GLOM|nr:16259_t:CDS:1 [Funneliformis geosporum]CAI2190268.1 6602_t:CDS:1 [Funneliformis geosporum]
MTELLPLQEEYIKKLKLNELNGNRSTKKSSSDNESSKKDQATGKPSGIFLDKDGKPCRACTAFRDWTKRGKKKESSQHNNEKSKKENKPNNNATGGITNNNSQELPPDCPPDSEQLGRATWTFLHTMAAYYPEVPSSEQQINMRNLLSGFSQFYPCWYCAEHLREEMKKVPPKVESRWALGIWLCDMHNIVNERLGKPIFDCNKINERWKDGPKNGQCD